MMGVFKKKPGGRRKTTDQKKSVRIGRSLPTDTYYSPRKGSRNTVATDGAAQRKRTHAAKSAAHLASSASRWAGVLVLGGTLLFNSGLFSTGVKVRYGTGEDPESPFRSSEEYAQVVSDVFSRSKLNNSKATLNSVRFEQEVAQVLPEVKSTTAVVPLAGTKLQVGLEIADVLVRFQNGSQTGLLSADGRLIVAEASSALLGDFFDVPTLTVQPSVEFDIGSQVLTSDELGLTTLLMQELDGTADYRPRPKSITYSIAARELRVSFFGASYYAKLSTERGAEVQVGALIASLKEFSEEGVVPEEYIDVRVGGRVFVR